MTTVYPVAISVHGQDVKGPFHPDLSKSPAKSCLKHPPKKKGLNLRSKAFYYSTTSEGESTNSNGREWRNLSQLENEDISSHLPTPGKALESFSEENEQSTAIQVLLSYKKSEMIEVVTSISGTERAGHFVEVNGQKFLAGEGIKFKHKFNTDKQQVYEEGFFCNNKLHGDGFRIYPNGDVIIGEFIKGVFHGEGIRIMTNDRVVIGYNFKGKQVITPDCGEDIKNLGIACICFSNSAALFPDEDRHSLKPEYHDSIESVVNSKLLTPLLEDQLAKYQQCHMKWKSKKNECVPLPLERTTLPNLPKIPLRSRIGNVLKKYFCSSS